MKKRFARKINKLIRAQRRSLGLNRFISASKRIAVIALAVLTVNFSCLMSVEHSKLDGEWNSIHSPSSFYVLPAKLLFLLFPLPRSTGLAAPANLSFHVAGLVQNPNQRHKLIFGQCIIINAK